MKFLKPSLRYLPVLNVALVLLAYGSGLACGVFTFNTKISTHTILVKRPLISAHATLAQVNANIVGKPYVEKAQLSELPGFLCSAWSNGTKGHGWVLIECVK